MYDTNKQIDMGYKMKRGNSAVPFKELGSSPAKQAIGGGPGEAVEHYDKWKKSKSATGGDPKLEKLKADRIANTKSGKIIKFGEGSNIIAERGPIDPWSSGFEKTAKKGVRASKGSFDVDDLDLDLGNWG